MMHRLPCLLLVAAMTLMLGACSLTDLRPHDPSPDTVANDSEPVDDESDIDETLEPEFEIIIELSEPAPVPGLLDEILLSGQSWLALSEEARRQEMAQAELAWFSDPDEVNLVRYALLTTLSPSMPETTERVSGKLRQWLAEQEMAIGQNELAPLASLLLHLLTERDRQLTGLRMELKELQGKLDDLRAIEQHMRERESTEIIRTLP